MGGSVYAYDGAGNRISQTVGVDVTQYLLDLQPGLATVLQATQDSDTTRYLHVPRGIHAQQDASNDWTWMLQDGLGSVRSVVDDSLSVLESRLYEPYGTPFGASGTSQTVYGFTGEPVDGNELVYLRARYYAPSLGVFTRLDPFEGMAQRPMSLNGYSWVEGNVVNAVDPSGMQACSQYEYVDARAYASCLGVNACPSGYPVGDRNNPQCVLPDGSGQYASNLWEDIWFPPVPYGGIVNAVQLFNAIFVESEWSQRARQNPIAFIRDAGYIVGDTALLLYGGWIVRGVMTITAIGYVGGQVSRSQLTDTPIQISLRDLSANLF